MAEEKKDTAPDIPPTDILYLSYEGNFALTCDATVLSCESKPIQGKSDKVTEHEVNIVVDRTVMYAKGGGQPSDVGKIIPAQFFPPDDTAAVVAEISTVSLDRASGIASHVGTVADTVSPAKDFSPGTAVKILVSPDLRHIHSECQTAGHVVDSVMDRIGLGLRPIKGYHFLDSPYVEYKGKIEENERADVLEKMKVAFRDLVNEDIKTTIDNLPVDEAEAECNRLSQNFDFTEYRKSSNLEVRIVRVAGWPVPCGGTHVRSTGVLKQNGWGITGLRCKKGVVRVKYNRGCDNEQK